MASAIEAYRDNRGNLHHTPAGAVVADIAAILGRVGDEGGLTEGVARLILQKRSELQEAFAHLEMLEGRTAAQVEFNDRPRLVRKSA